MSLSADERATLLEQVAALADDADPRPVTTFLTERADRMLTELADRPGFDAVRAATARALPLLDPRLTAGWAAALTEALARYPEDVGAGDPTVLLARHPAWAGLAALELRLATGSPLVDAIDDATRTSRVGFAAVGDGRGTRRGTVLWALAERAEEAGWTARARALLDAAQHGPFDDDADAARVLLLRGLGAAEVGRADAEDLLSAAVVHEASAAPGRIHARWVLAALARRRDDAARARDLLAAALGDADDEPAEIGERLREALAALD